MSANGMVGRTAALCLCFIVTAGVLARASMAEPTPTRTSFTQLPYRIGQFQGRHAGDLDQEVVDVLGVEEYVNRTYRASAGSLPVGFYLGYWASQRQGDAIHSPMNCLPGAGWAPVENSRINVPLGSGESQVNRVIIEKSGERLLVLYWYQSHGRVVASEYWSKIHMVLDAMKTARTDAALVRIVVPIPNAGATADAEREALNFAKALYPMLEQHLPA
jgi:EpsI family protein